MLSSSERVFGTSYVVYSIIKRVDIQNVLVLNDTSSKLHFYNNRAQQCRQNQLRVIQNKASNHDIKEPTLDANREVKQVSTILVIVIMINHNNLTLCRKGAQMLTRKNHQVLD